MCMFLYLQAEEIQFPGQPFTPNNTTVYSQEFGDDVSVAVLNTEDNRIYGSDGKFGYICQSCSHDIFECPAVCLSCKPKENEVVVTQGNNNNTCIIYFVKPPVRISSRKQLYFNFILSCTRLRIEMN